jgi:hypothetical protein
MARPFDDEPFQLAFVVAPGAAERASGDGLSSFRSSNSGSLAKLAAMRRASLRVSSLAAERWHEDWSLARTRGSIWTKRMGAIGR